MSAPLRRRREPQPVSRGWELAVVLVGGVLTGIVLAAFVGIALTAAWWGGGWVWPRGTQAATSVVAGLLRGDPSSGYPPEQASLVATASVAYLGVAASEVLVWTAVLGLAVVVRTRLFPGDARRGMATRADAERALGVRQLRAARAVIRPDLHGTPR